MPYASNRTTSPASGAVTTSVRGPSLHEPSPFLAAPRPSVADVLGRTIWAPNGTTFRFDAVPNPDAKTETEILEDPGFLRYELTGPNDHDHVWIFTQSREFVDAGHDDVPMEWTILARIAFDAWVEMDAAFS